MAMINAAPSSSPKTKRPPLERRGKILIGLAVVGGVFGVAVGVLRIVGLIHPFLVPTGTMAPTIDRGDHVLMEGLTFLARKPRRGDIAVFKTDNIAQLPP